VYLHVPNPTHAQLLKGVFVALGATLAISVVVHAGVARLFSLVGGRAAPAGAVARA
jgi:hypothetical protein